MLLLPLLLAGLVDLADEAARRARGHELRGRLGLRPEGPEGGDARSRVLSIWQRYDGWSFRRTLSDALSMLYGRTYSREEMEVPPFANPYGGRNPLTIPHLGLPAPGVRERWDPMLDWLAVLFARLERAEATRMPAQVGPPVRRPWSADGLRDLDTMRRQIREDLHNLVDWFEAERPNLGRFTWDEAVAASDAWHQTFLAVFQETGIPASGIVVASWQDGSRVERLLTRLELEQEGEAMEHCVGGRWSDVREGVARIYSYRNAEGKPLATWEIGDEDGRFVLEDLEGQRNQDVTASPARHRIGRLLKAWRVPIGSRGHKIGLDTADDVPPPVVPAMLLPEELRATMAKAGRLLEADQVEKEERERGMDKEHAQASKVFEAVDEYQNAVDVLEAESEILTHLHEVAHIQEENPYVFELADEMGVAGAAEALPILEAELARVQGVETPGPVPVFDAAALPAWSEMVPRMRRDPQWTESSWMRALRVAKSRLQDVAWWETFRKEEAEARNEDPAEVDPAAMVRDYEYWRLAEDQTQVFSAADRVVEALNRLLLDPWGISALEGRERHRAWEDWKIWEVWVTGSHGDPDVVGHLAFTLGNYGGEPLWTASTDDDYRPTHGSSSKLEPLQPLFTEGLLETLHQAVPREARQAKAREEAATAEGVVMMPTSVALVADPALFLRKARDLGVEIPAEVESQYRRLGR